MDELVVPVAEPSRADAIVKACAVVVDEFDDGGDVLPFTMTRCQLTVRDDESSPTGKVLTGNIHFVSHAGDPVGVVVDGEGNATKVNVPGADLSELTLGGVPLDVIKEQLEADVLEPLEPVDPTPSDPKGKL